MHKVPEHINDIVVDACKKFPRDIDSAVDWAMTRIEALGEADKKLLITIAVRSLINDARHAYNTEVKRRGDFYGGTAKVGASKNGRATVNRIWKNAELSYLGIKIRGVMLGDLTGAQLRDEADAAQRKVTSWTFNARLCLFLADRVPEHKRVRDVFSDRQLGKHYERLKKEVEEETGGVGASETEAVVAVG